MEVGHLAKLKEDFHYGDEFSRYNDVDRWFVAIVKFTRVVANLFVRIRCVSVLSRRYHGYVIPIGGVL